MSKIKLINTNIPISINEKYFTGIPNPTMSRAKAVNVQKPMIGIRALDPNFSSFSLNNRKYTGSPPKNNIKTVYREIRN